MTSILKVNQIQNTTGGVPTAADLGLNVTGSVLQVVDATGSTETQIGSGSQGTWVTTDASITITPSFASSKVYITHMAGGLSQYAQDIGLRLLRGSTVTYESERFGYQVSNQNWTPANYPLSYVDTPSTTSATTYTIQIRHNSSIGVIRHCDNATWSMVAMEIAG